MPAEHEAPNLSAVMWTAGEPTKSADICHAGDFV
jgi:hypothetical protein